MNRKVNNITNNKFPRVLVISNECISQSSSNGRTLRNFLIGWETDCIAQFYIKGNNPDYDVCKNYFNVSDAQAIVNTFFNRISYAKINNKPKKYSKYHTTKFRNSLTMFIREIIWNSNRWKNYGFTEWIRRFDPEKVLLQAGDSAFMYKLARNIATCYNIPLIIYNSENYYFKKYDYFQSKGIPHLIYPIYHKYFCSEVKKTIEVAQKSIYISDALKDDYDKEFNKPSITIYTATEIKFETKRNINNVIRISYLGNLGVGRHEALVDVAEVIQKVSKNICLDVYAKFPNNEIKDYILKCKSICYKGFVSYQEVVNVMKNSDIIVHVENFRDKYCEGLKRAFSTKIADSLACGTCFLLYAPSNLSLVKYLKNYNAAYVISNKEILKEVIKNLINSKEARNKYISNAQKLVELNHSSEKNSKLFQKVLRE